MQTLKPFALLLPAHAHQLRYLDDTRHRLDAEHPPAALTRGDRRETERGDRRQHRMRVRQVDPHAIERPHLHDEVVGGVSGGKPRREQVLDRLIAQDERRLAQVIVEELIGLRERVAVDDPAAGGADQHHTREQLGEQPRPERAHAEGLRR